jgi:peptidoglycan LD-endopeptidase LytH
LSPRNEVQAVMKRMGAAPQCTILCASKAPPAPVRKPTRKPTRKPEPQVTLGTGTLNG